MGRAIVTPKKQVRVGVCSVMPAHTTECFDNSEMVRVPGSCQLRLLFAAWACA